MHATFCWGDDVVFWNSCDVQDDLDFEFPPTPGVSGPGILGVPGSRSTSDTFSNIFVGNMCCDPFACSDRSRDVDQLDASVESQLSFVQRFLEPVL